MNPDTVRSLRDRLGWTAGEFGAFFGRTRATVYAWERGSGMPDATVSALIESLRRETEHRRAHQTRTEYLNWVEELKDESVGGYLRRLQSGSTSGFVQSGRDNRAGEGRSERNAFDGPADGVPPDPVVYLVPVPRDVRAKPTGEGSKETTEKTPDPVSGLVELLLDRLPAVE